MEGVKEREKTILLALKMEIGTMSQERQVTSSGWRSRGNVLFYSRVPRRNTATLDF